MKSDFDAKILIAGHKGMVGSTIQKILERKGYNNITGMDRGDIDFRRQAEVEDMFERIKPKYVILAAAKVGGIVANNTYKAEFIYDNMAIAMNIIHTAHSYGVKKLLNLGSSCIYPKYAPQPMNESHLLTGELEPTNEPYAIAKISAIKLCRYYNEQYGNDFISVMPTNLYGKNDNYNLETSHVLPALVRKMVLAKALGDHDFDYIARDLSGFRIGWDLDEKADMNDADSLTELLGSIGISSQGVKVWGTGKVMREFLHVNDMADACVYLMENYSYSQIGEFVNIGSGEDLSIAELAELIKSVTGYKGDIVFDSDKPEGTPRKLLDVSRLNSLGWKANISLRQGIEKVLNDYKKAIG